LGTSGAYRCRTAGGKRTKKDSSLPEDESCSGVICGVWGKGVERNNAEGESRRGGFLKKSGKKNGVFPMRHRSKTKEEGLTKARGRRRGYGTGAQTKKKGRKIWKDPISKVSNSGSRPSQGGKKSGVVKRKKKTGFFRQKRREQKTTLSGFFWAWP